MSGFDPRQFQDMLQQAQQQAEALQQKMKQTVVEASSGGGAVTVKMNGQKQLLETHIDTEAVKGGDVEMLQDLVTAAVNEAGRKVDQAMQASVGGMLGGLGIPGI
jgi:DNA-binding YbaB/EbfC family protein